MSELQTFDDFKGPVLKREVGTPKRRMASVLELAKKKELSEAAVQREWQKFFNVWIMEPPVALKNALEVADDDRVDFQNKKRRQAEMFAFMDEKNDEIGPEDKEARRLSFTFIDSGGDLIYRLNQAYQARIENGRRYVSLSSAPEIIVVVGKTNDALGSTNANVVNLIRQKVREFIEALFSNEEAWAEEILGSSVVIPFYNSYEQDKANLEMSGGELLEYGVMALEESREHYEKLIKASAAYMETGKAEVLAAAFSDEYLKIIFENLKIYDELRVESFVDDNFEWESNDSDRRVMEPWNEGMSRFESEDEYIEYRRALCAKVAGLDFDEVKDQMRRRYVQIIIDELDRQKARFQVGVDMAEWETNLLQPIIISVSANQAFNENNLQNGANLALTDLSREDMERLVAFVNRIKNSPASLSSRKLLREKKRFYEAVEDQIKERSKVTADTRKELSMLREVFEANNVESVLDVGCGYGRISLPLIEAGYRLDGIEGNEKFLTEVKQEAQIRTGDSRFVFGSIIDYQGPQEEYDSVIYTWNTILEAFGPGNLLKSLNSAWKNLKAGGVLVFDQPTRENPNMADGWYGQAPKGVEETSYLSYIMTEEEIRFVLRISGFTEVKIKKWQTAPNNEYPKGVNKILVTARKPKIEGFRLHKFKKEELIKG